MSIPGIDAYWGVGYPRYQPRQWVWARGDRAAPRISGIRNHGVDGRLLGDLGRLQDFDADHFVRQVAAMAHFTGELMVADLKTIATK